METLKKKIAVVTGGTRGIGYGVAEVLVQEGAKVSICGRDEARVKAAIESLSRAGSAGQVHGSVGDILVNNAGVGIFKPIDQMTPEEWDTVIETNLSGVFYCCHEAIPLMRQRGGGYIFNISSLAGVNAFPGGSAYNASKFGLNGFSEAMMQEVRYDGIRVTYVMPGSVATDFGAAPDSRPRESWKLTTKDIAKAVIDLYKLPSSALASRIEMRPSQPPRKK
jgi:3-oxoacyl-[acyl-carrier protein] reductase